MEEKALELTPLKVWVDAFLDHLKVERGASLHTVAAYGNDLAKLQGLLTSIGITCWEDVEGQHLSSFEASLVVEGQKSTAQRRLSGVRSFLKFLARNGVLVKGDLPSTGGFRKAKHLPKALNPEQVQALVDQQQVMKPSGLRDRALLELIYGGGLRVSEAVDLELSALDLNGFTVRIFGKRGKTRHNPLPEGTVDWLKAYIEFGRPSLSVKPSKYLFVSDRGKKLLRQTAYKIVDKYRTRAGLSKGVSPHTLRHSFAVDMLTGGADLRVVQELLGHASIATTQIYTYLDLQEVRKRYDRAHPRR
jgi:integrase/recombinase XerD